MSARTITRSPPAGPYGGVHDRGPKMVVLESRMQIYLNRAAVKLAGFQAGDRIVFVLDDEGHFWGMRKASPKERSWRLSAPNTSGLLTTCSSFLKESGAPPSGRYRARFMMVDGKPTLSSHSVEDRIDG